MKTHILKASGGIGALALVAIAMPAAAQNAAPVAPANSDIVVTAMRSESTLQKTPLAVTVYSGKDLLQRDVTNINALQAVDTSLQITNNTGTAFIGVRGTQSTNTTEVGNPSVSVARDGFFTNRPFTLGLSFYDLARVEILKGPQGTLFGRNSTGGLVNIITAKPKLGKTEGYVSATAGNYALIGGEGAINLPIGENLAVRLAAFGRSRDGYRALTGLNGRGDDDRSASGRAQVYWEPSSAFDLLVSYQHDKQRGVGDVQAIGTLGSTFTGDPKRFAAYEPTSIRADVDRVTWAANLHNLPFDGTLTYAGGYDNTRYQRVGDTSGVDPTGTFVLTQFGTDQHVRTQNHEVRFATSTANRFYIQLGGFYFREENGPLTSGQIIKSGTYADQYVIRFNYNVVSLSKALFGQASYAVTPTIKATVGGRYSWDSVTRTGSNDLRCDIAGIPAFLYGALGCAGTPPVQNTPANGRQTASKFTYRLGLNWDVTPQNMLYAKFDTGYKPGGFSTDPTNPNNQFGPETVQSFEFGSKNRFFDGRLTFNADVFYQVLDGFQATLPRSLGAGTINAGKTNTYGAEIFARAALTSSTHIDVSTTLLHSRFDKNVAKVDDGSGTLINISNNRLPNAPDVVIAGGIDQDIALGHGKVTLRLDGRYSSQVYFDFVNRADTRAPAVAVGNFTIGYEQGPWRVQAFAKNFTDALVYARINRTSLISAQTWQFQAPRTLGVQGTYRF